LTGLPVFLETLCPTQFDQPFFRQPQTQNDMYGPYNHEWMFDGGFGMLFVGLWMILVWGIPLLLAVALLKYLFAKSRGKADFNGAPEQKAPLDILKEAYARGEIGRDEYLQKRDDLLEK
jgi:putative membrane protein